MFMEEQTRAGSKLDDFFQGNAPSAPSGVASTPATSSKSAGTPPPLSASSLGLDDAFGGANSPQGPQTAPQGSPSQGTLAAPDKSTCFWAMLCHLVALIAAVGIPLANIAAPLGLWWMKRKSASFVDHNGKEAVNFQISMTIYALMILAFQIGLRAAHLIPPHQLTSLIVIIGLINLALVVIAAAKAQKGEKYEYPFTIQFLK
jgi:uncharacterized protein